MNISEIGSTLSKGITGVKVSVNGMWENGWMIPFENGMPSQPEIETYLQKGTEGIAFQMFFTSDEGYNIIIGIRYKEGLRTKTPEEFLQMAFNIIWSTHPATFTELVQRVSEALTGDANNLFGTDPTGVELGVIGYWKSVGYLEIWDSSKSKSISREELQKIIHTKPEFIESDKSYVALELNYHTVPHYWIGIQISDKQDEHYRINFSRFEFLLQKLLGISLT